MKLVKVCGLKDEVAVRAADEADYAGFVVGSPRSPRNISIQKFNKLRCELTKSQPVLVTVNPSLKFLYRLHQIEGVTIQLHGNSRIFARYLSNTALGLNLREYKKVAQFDSHDYKFLTVDTTVESGYGGTGRSWEWEPLNSTNILLVAGGIGFENVESALLSTNCQGVDVSSALEANGKKDPELITDFIELVRSL